MLTKNKVPTHNKIETSTKIYQKKSAHNKSGTYSQQNINMSEHSNLTDIFVNKKIYISYRKKNSQRAWRDATPNSTHIYIKT